MYSPIMGILVVLGSFSRRSWVSFVSKSLGDWIKLSSLNPLQASLAACRKLLLCVCVWLLSSVLLLERTSIYLYQTNFKIGVPLHFFWLGIVAQGHRVCSQIYASKWCSWSLHYQGQQLKPLVCKTGDWGIIKSNCYLVLLTRSWWQGVVCTLKIKWQVLCTRNSKWDEYLTRASSTAIFGLARSHFIVSSMNSLTSALTVTLWTLNSHTCKFTSYNTFLSENTEITYLISNLTK